MGYNAVPPVVTCLSGEFIDKHGSKASVEASGQVALNICQLGGPSGWSRGYTISDVVHCIHQKLLILGVPRVRIVASGTGGSDSPLARSHLRSLPSVGPPPRLSSGQHGLQGKRPTMEDETVCADSMTAGGSSVGFYAVYDGHGGSQASSFVKAHLHTAFIDNMRKGQDMRMSLWSAFATTDAAFEKMHGADDSASRDLSGTTAAVAVVNGRTVLVGNVGDSRVVLSRNGTAVNLTVDHKADRPDEVARISNAGGFVVHGRWVTPVVSGVACLCFWASPYGVFVV